MVADHLNSDSVTLASRELMQHTIEAYRNELAKIRTGQAQPNLLQHVMVEYYGTPTPLNQVASISVENARTLNVTPFERQLIPQIEKAIVKADLGLNPSTSLQVIRIPLPPLTEERRRELVKCVREETEKARIAIRNHRRDANQQLKNLLKSKAISEDEERRVQAKIQKLTDDMVLSIDKIADQKEADLMTV